MDKKLENFIQSSYSEEDFLQSQGWRKFQESVGYRTFNISVAGFSASIIEHKLPVVGKYFYMPRGPVISDQKTVNREQYFNELITLSKENNVGWIRIEPENEETLEIIKKAVGADLASAQNGQTPASTQRGEQDLSLQSSNKYKIIKSPHDMQPREILVLDITKSEEQLLAEMKPKTRYNIRLAEKKEVRIKKQEESGEYTKDFLRLVKITAKRNKITSHPDSYYRKMLEVIPGDILKLYVAEYKDKVVAANIMVFYPHTKTTPKEFVDDRTISNQKNNDFGVGVYGKTATYLHGGSDDQYKNLMAPYLLQWQTIKDAKKAGCEKYDLGGISTNYESSTNIRITNKWRGITRFKLGFSPDTKPIEFPGCYDIVLSPVRYWLYRKIQIIKSFIK